MISQLSTRHAAIKLALRGSEANFGPEQSDLITPTHV